MPEMPPIVCPPPLLSLPSSLSINLVSHESTPLMCPASLITPPPHATLPNGIPNALALPKIVHKVPTMPFGGRGVRYTCCLNSFHCRCLRHYCHPKSIIWGEFTITHLHHHRHHLHIQDCCDYHPERVDFICVIDLE